MSGSWQVFYIKPDFFLSIDWFNRFLYVYGGALYIGAMLPHSYLSIPVDKPADLVGNFPTESASNQ